MLEFKNVYKSYGKLVLENLTFSLKTGEKLAIIGDSGIGKTTIFNLILSFTLPDSGEVINDFKRISTVFQENRLIEEISALDNLKLVTDQREVEIIDLLRSLEIDSPMKKVGELSGGMKRRVAIARALAYGGDLLLLDEPIQGMDKRIRSLVINKIFNLYKDKALILISHYKQDIKDFEIDNIIRIKNPIE